MRVIRHSIIVLSLGALILPTIVFAEGVGAFASFIGVAYADWRLVTIRILQIIWIFASVGALGFLIYGYVLYRQADPEDLEEEPHAKRMMFYSGIALAASILLVIILSIVYGVIEGGYAKTGGPGGGQKPYTPGLGAVMSTATSKIKDHYPASNEQNVPRDTSILITFADAINKDSVLDSTNGIKKESIIIRRSAAGLFGDYGVVRSTGVLSADGTTLKIVPSVLLGDADKKVRYSVVLTNAILKKDGTPLFGTSDSGFVWQFEVSGLIDTTPPTIDSYLPVAQSISPINSIIQVTFSEPIDPFVVNTQVLDVSSGLPGSLASIPGTWTVGNGYRTITFVSSNQCGTNQCGSAVFCLPSKNQFTIRLKAAALKGQVSGRDNPNKASFPYTGIVDASGNSLDGGGVNGAARNGKSDGAEKDDFYWNFTSSSEKETTVPAVLSIQPGRDASGVSLTAPVDIVFSKLMDFTTLNVSTIGFTQELNYWITSKYNFTDRQTRAQLQHDAFKTQSTYTPVVKSPVADVYQNCYNPCNGPGVIYSSLK
ncbi:MAG: Ig-like domain-containing protein [Candidatus Uhrbacteria bacterium]|nr:Ig-like domain-containing protein [Candidatus Uhrbacteria bacterium]